MPLFGHEIRWCFAVSEAVTKAYSLCFGGWLAARCGKQLEKAKKLSVVIGFQKGR